MAKQNKQSEFNEEVSFDFSNIEKADEKLNVTNSTGAKTVRKKTGKKTRSLLLVIHKDTIEEFNSLLNAFLKKSKSYKYSSKAMFFSITVDYLYKQMKEPKTVPNVFVQHIYRRGKRPKTHRTFPTSETDKLFLKVDEVYYLNYLSLIYNYLLDKDDIYNLSYSVSYFFYDYMDMLRDNFEAIVKYYKVD